MEQSIDLVKAAAAWKQLQELAEVLTSDNRTRWEKFADSLDNLGYWLAYHLTLPIAGFWRGIKAGATDAWERDE